MYVGYVLLLMPNSMNAGHYIAFVKYDDQWWEINDECVARVSEDMVDDNEEEQPYLLFFRRLRVSR